MTGCGHCGLPGHSWRECSQRHEEYALETETGADLAFLGGKGLDPHLCEGCRQTFSSVKALFAHDCDGQYFDDDAPPGGGSEVVA